MPAGKFISVVATALLGGALAPAFAVDTASSRPETRAIANPALWPRAASPDALTDVATEAAIDALIARMTEEQKIGQLIQADIGSITPADLSRYPLGSILAGGNSGPYGDERADAASWLKLVNAFRTASIQAGAGIPILFGIDAVHGHSNVPGATLFPHNIGLGAAHDPDLIYRIGQVTAAEVAATGIEWTFAPTLAVPQDLRWGRSYEGYAADPNLVASYGRAMTLGLQGVLTAGVPLGPRQVAATAKHFLADGGTLDGRDQGDARLPEADLIRLHAPGYPAAIDAGALTVMASFSSWNGVKHHGNASLLTDVLKQKMGFAGLVVGDWNGHGQVPGCAVTRCATALNAGLDLFMAPDSWRGLFDSTLADLREGRIAQARVDDAVRRILRVKFKLGLMGDAPIQRGNPSQLGAAEHLALAREAVAKSLVLLKNEGNALPIKPGARVLIAGPGADSMAMQAGGWTISWQGSDTQASDFPKGQTIGQALVAAIKETGGEADLAPDGRTTSKPDLAIIVMGEEPYAEFHGDVAHLAFLPRKGEEDLVDRLKQQGAKVVIVFLSGRPLFTSRLINKADAFVAAWLPGSQGAGVADVLVAKKDGQPRRDFTGRLPFSWPANALSPIASPLWPAGYGLSYAAGGTVGSLSEAPGLDFEASSKKTFFFRKGVVPAPWHLATGGLMTARPVDLSAQEDARQFSWQGAGRLSVEGAAVSMADQEEAALLLDWRIDQLGRGPVRLSLGDGALDISTVLKAARRGAAIQTLIPLRCFVAAGGSLAQVGAPLRIDADSGFAVTIRDVQLSSDHLPKGKGACPPVAR